MIQEMPAFDVQRYCETVKSSFTKRVEVNALSRLLGKFSRKKSAIEKAWREARDRVWLSDHHPDIFAMQLKAREGGGLAGEYQWLRHREIAAAVEEFRPLSVCEFGCGTSSALFGKLIGDIRKFTTHEEDDTWLSRMFVSAGQQAEHIAGVRANRVTSVKDGEAVVHYDIDHDRYFDFVYVDGPYSSLKPTDSVDPATIRDPDGTMPNIDVELFWENGHYPKVIMIDGRRSTVRRLVEKSAGRYKLHLKSDYLQRVGIPDFTRYRYHSILIRNER